MAIDISLYVQVNATLVASGAPQASFSTPAYINVNSYDSNTLQGPFTSVADVEDFGAVAGDALHDYAIAFTSQNPRPAQFYSIRDSGSGPAAALTAALAVNAGAFYCVHMESRLTDDIIAVSALIETVRKIAIFQSNDPSLLDTSTGLSFSADVGGTATDGTYILTFTGFGLVSPVAVTVTRVAGSPATNALIGDAFRTALTTAAGGSLSGELLLASIGGTGATVTFSTADGLIGTVTASGTAVAGAGDLTVTVTDGDVGSQLFALQRTRSALVFHATDSELLAESWAARCLGNDLDDQQLSWSYKKINGIAGATLTTAQVTALRNANVNYFADAVSSAGQNTVAFTAQGVFPVGTAGHGRLIRVQTSVDWMQARKEEAIINVLLSEPDAVFLDDAGIHRFVTASDGVNTKGIGADHLIEKVVPEGQDFEGRQTPLIDVPLAAEMDPTDIEQGVLRMTELVYLKPSAEKVVLNVEVRQA